MASLSTVKARVGSMKWRNETLLLTGESDKMTRKADQDYTEARTNNIESGARRTLTQMCNNEANTKFRSIRKSSNKARECLIDLNEQIRSMIRGQEMVGKMEGRVSKALEKNKMCYVIRSQRTRGEKSTDDADVLIGTEEGRLKEMVQALKRTHKKLTECSAVLVQHRKDLNQYLSYQAQFLALTPDNTLPASGDVEGIGDGDGLQKVIEEVKAHLEICKQLRKEVEATSSSFDASQREVVAELDAALRGKIKETQQLKTDIRNAIGRNKKAASKSVSLFHQSQHSWLDIKGPENGMHANTSEHRNRPLINSLRNPAHQALEEKQLNSGSESLFRSMKQTVERVEDLKWMQQKLAQDASNKHNAISVDLSAVVARRQK